ncbi:methionine ABC transporter ATP-binding protein, partial [Staphylococcus arlettae]|uniref:NIL domain-containing protein n=1 Tax=Staphylococcus arlettae TaxID=29378 RepID=UPI000D43DDB1
GSVIEIGSVLEVFSHPKTKTAKSFVSTVISTDISDKMIHQLPTDADYVDVKVYLEGSQIGLSVIQTLIKDFNLDVNVIYASMSEIQDTSGGYLTRRIKGSNESNQRAFDYM